MSHRLRNVADHHAFYARDGKVLRNMYELEKGLRHMDHKHFKHHANDDKNDFHNWVMHVVQDARLAQQLSELLGQKEMAKAVKLRIRELEQKKTVDSTVMKHIHRRVFRKKKARRL